MQILMAWNSEAMGHSGKVSLLVIRSLHTCTAASVCDWLWPWQRGDSGSPFRKKSVKHFWPFNLSHSAWLCAVHDLGCGSCSGRGVALETLHYLHSSFRPEWRGSPHCTRSGSCRLCWYSDRCYRSGRSEDTRLCLRLKWEKNRVNLEDLKLLSFSLHFQT